MLIKNDVPPKLISDVRAHTDLREVLSEEPLNKIKSTASAYVDLY
jgi:hypothetical protein